MMDDEDDVIVSVAVPLDFAFPLVRSDDLVKAMAKLSVRCEMRFRRSGETIDVLSLDDE